MSLLEINGTEWQTPPEVMIAPGRPDPPNTPSTTSPSRVQRGIKAGTTPQDCPMKVKKVIVIPAWIPSWANAPGVGPAWIPCWSTSLA